MNEVHPNVPLLLSSLMYVDGDPSYIPTNAMVLPPQCVCNPSDIVALEKSLAQILSMDSTVESGFNSDHLGTHSLLGRVETASWDGAAADSNCTPNCWAMVHTTSLLTTSPTTMLGPLHSPFATQSSDGFDHGGDATLRNPPTCHCWFVSDSKRRRKCSTVILEGPPVTPLFADLTFLAERPLRECFSPMPIAETRTLLQQIWQHDGVQRHECGPQCRRPERLRLLPLLPRLCLTPSVVEVGVCEATALMVFVGPPRTATIERTNACCAIPRNQHETSSTGRLTTLQLEPKWSGCRNKRGFGPKGSTPTFLRPFVDPFSTAQFYFCPPLTLIM